MTINNTYQEQDLSLKSQNPAGLHFFQMTLNCIIFNFNKEISKNCEFKILLLHFSN